MIINVSYSELESTQDKLSDFQSDVASTMHELLNKICCSEEHMNFCESKVRSRITEWQHKVSLLERRITVVKEEIRKTEDALRRKQEEAERLQRELANCRPPKTVYYQETDEKGNTVTKSRVEDPDGAKRARLQAELSRLLAEIANLERKLADLNQQLSVLESDRAIAIAYLQKMEQLNRKISQSKVVLSDVRRKVNGASSNAQEESATLLSAIDQMELALQRYDNHNYRDAYSCGTSSKIRIPNLHRSSFRSGGYVPGAPSARTQRNAGTYAPEREPLRFPAKLRLISEKDCKVEIIGVYEESAELATDIDTARKILGKHMTFCVKKPITVPTPCFATVKDLHDFLTMQGFHAKLTAMGTRYTDMNGYIYFIS